MKKLITGLLSCFAVVILMVPMAFAQTPDGETPANEGVCDELQYNSTSGLYGLCVAFCEAQDAEATFDPTTGEITFAEDARPSNPKLLEIYNRKKTEYDPPMPCVNVVEAGCPCWTEAEIAAIGTDGQFCLRDNPRNSTFINNDARELALGRLKRDMSGNFCALTTHAPNPELIRRQDIDDTQLAICQTSIVDQCVARGVEIIVRN